MSKYLIAFLLPLVALAQPKTSLFDTYRSKAFQHIFSNPDSARFYIQKLDESTDKKNDTLVAKLYNTYGLYYYQITKKDSAEHYYKKAIDLNKSNCKIKGSSYTNLGNLYTKSSKFELADKNLRKGLNEFKKCDYKLGIANAYSEISSLKAYMIQDDSTIHYLLKSVKIFKESKDKRGIYITTQKLGNAYFKMKNYQTAIDLYQECLVAMKEDGDMLNYFGTLVNLGDCLTYIKEYGRAKKAIYEAIGGIQKFNNAEYLSIAYNKLGVIYYEEKNLDKALEYTQLAYTTIQPMETFRVFRIASDYINVLNDSKMYNQAIAVIHYINTHPRQDLFNIEDQLHYEQAKAKTYKAVGDSYNYTNTLERIIDLKDKVHDAVAEASIKEIQAKHLVEIQKEKANTLSQQNQYLSEKIKVQNRNYILIGIIVFIILSGSIYIVSKYKRRQKISQIKLKSYANENKIILEQNKQTILEAQEQREKIETKEKELTSMTLQLADLQEQIISIIKNEKLEKAEQIKKALKQVINQKDYWSEFSMKFKNIHPKFYDNIKTKYPNLTKNDINFLSLVKLNLSNKEIATLLQISHESVISKKYRIKKKMLIEDDKEFSDAISMN